MLENAKFSVIIPIYKVEGYLEETIESVVNQTIGFKENIQLILVNDGSPDNSEEICLKYKKLYPENIIYVKQKNSGVSSARNNGLKFATGEFVNFLDSDDKWNFDAFEKVKVFFEENTDYNFDFVACRLNFFEARKGFSHPMDFKFRKGNRIINILEEPNSLILHVSSCFFRRESCLADMFNTNLKYSEDTLAITMVLMKTLNYGVLESAIFNYRKRVNQSSAIDKSFLDIDWYTKSFEYYYDNLISTCISKYNFLLEYIQYLIMYDLQWRLKQPVSETVVSDIQKKDYIYNIKRILKCISDKIIYEQKQIEAYYKNYALILKYDRDITRELIQIKDSLYFNNIKVFSSSWHNVIFIDDIKLVNDNLYKVTGLVKTIISNEELKIYVENEKKERINFIKYERYPHKEMPTVESLDIYCQRYFEINLPVDEADSSEYIFYAQYKNNLPIPMNVSTLNQCRLNTISNEYFLKDKKYLVLFKDMKMSFIKQNKIGIKLSKKIEKNIQKIMWNKNAKKLSLLRKLITFLKPIIHKHIWLISDRPFKAGDNGEALFMYLQSNPIKNVNTYFVIDKTSEDYDRIRKIGKVLEFNSLKTKIFYLLANKVISSQAEEFIYNPFGKNKKFMKDLYTFDFIFLQHGILEKDLSNWLHRVNKHISMMVCAAQKEYDSLLTYNYFFDKSVPKLTGQPRYDLLKNSHIEKKIIIIPTWRANLVQSVDQKTGLHPYNNDFVKTDYYKFYNNLINDKNLMECMKKNNYLGEFILHPCFVQQSVDFKSNECFKILYKNVNYNELFNTSALLVTDFSSVAFDFAYLYKPVIYAQFDYKDFYAGQVYDKGYFEYERDGFGTVTYNIENTVDSIIKLINNGCKNEKKYVERVNKFFPEERGHNCENVVREILNIGSEEKNEFRN